MEKSVVTLSRFILEQERRFPHATGAFTSILYDIGLAAKLIHRAVSMAGLVDVLGRTGARNIHGEDVKKLDEYAHDVMFNAMDHGGHLCVMVSEESEEIIRIPDEFPTGNYVLVFDPLDGSSNIDSNISIGTIFGLYQRVSKGRDGGVEDCLQPGARQVAAGYVMYGSSTVLVYTTGNGVHGFTLDPSIGEFLLSYPHITIPTPGQRTYSVNEGNYRKWGPEQQALVRRFRGEDGAAESFSMRYVGSLVSDFHRTLLDGGIFMYPAQEGAPHGKLRLLYEVAPLAMICKHAGGAATDGVRDILSIEPEDIHQRTPIYIGNREYVEIAGRYMRGEVVAADRGDGDGRRGVEATAQEPTTA